MLITDSVINYARIATMANLSDISILRKLGSIPVTSGVLLELYRHYAAPGKKIAELCLQGLLVRVKRGLYVVDEQVTGERSSGYLLANHLHGPSYVSLETAMEFHGLIPEAVYSFESATIGLSKAYATELGTFCYHHVPDAYYPLGIQQASAGISQTFLIASPEKAICDHLITTKRLRIRSRGALRSYLVEYLRIDEEALAELDSGLIHSCSLVGPKQETLRFLKEVIEWVQSSRA